MEFAKLMVILFSLDVATCIWYSEVDNESHL